MGLMDIVTAVLAFLLGVVVGAIVVGLAEALGIAGWLAGLLFALLVLAFVYVSDRMLGFELKYIVRLIAKMGNLDSTEIDAEMREHKSNRDYYAFFVGTLVGITTSLIWTPSSVFDALPF